MRVLEVAKKTFGEGPRKVLNGIIEVNALVVSPRYSPSNALVSFSDTFRGTAVGGCG